MKHQCPKSSSAMAAELCDGCRAEMPGPHTGPECHATTTTPAGRNTGRKDDSQKARFDLVPAGPFLSVVSVLTFGAGKYGDDNWRRVKDGRRRYFAAAMRHLWAYFQGEKTDPESGLPHLAHVITCCLFLMQPLEGDVASRPDAGGEASDQSL